MASYYDTEWIRILLQYYDLSDWWYDGSDQMESMHGIVVQSLTDDDLAVSIVFSCFWYALNGVIRLLSYTTNGCDGCLFIVSMLDGAHNGVLRYALRHLRLCRYC